MATLSPGLISIERFLIIGLLTSYEKLTLSKIISPLTSSRFVPVSFTNSSVSKILNTLLAATMPICNVLNLSAICLSGLKSI